MIDLTIVIVNFNSLKYLTSCVKSIKKNTVKNKYNFELIVVDNSSIREIPPDFILSNKIKIINNKTNLGYGAACNLGIKESKGQYVLLLNPDIIAKDQSIIKLLEYVKKTKGFAGGQLLNIDNTIQPSCGLFFSFPVVFAILFLGGERFQITKFSPLASKKVDWVSGGCLIGRRSDFLKFPFDEKIFLYTEEVEMLYRANINKVYCYYYKEAQFIHYGAVTSDRSESAIYLFKGLIYFYKKYYSLLSVNILISILKFKSRLSILLGALLFQRQVVLRYNKALKYLNQI